MALASCKQHQLTEGDYLLPVKGGNIWYKIVGSGNKTPLVMVHGGPGFPSYYLTSLIAELSKDRPVIVYDQLGSGRSGKLDDTSRMTVAAQLEDLKALLAHIGIDKFYLYGHSYGTILALEYYLQQPQQPKALIFASPCFSSDRWEKDADTLIATLDTTSKRVLQEAKAGKVSDSSLYKKAMDMYFASFYNRKTNANIDSSIQYSGNKLYSKIWGSVEFSADGELKGYDKTQALRKITLPTLISCGEYDAARPTTVKYYQSLIPNAKFELITNAAHSTMNDNTAADAAAITNFLSSLEK